MLNIPRLRAGVAQLVEQRIRNARVAGSTPVSGIIFIKQNNKLYVHNYDLGCSVFTVQLSDNIKFWRVGSQVAKVTTVSCRDG
jgi:hypothetical protein